MAQSMQLGFGQHDFQAELNGHLVQSRLPVRCGRRVRADGDCGYDSALANLEDGVIRQTISKMARDANMHMVEDIRKTIARFMATNKELHSLEGFKLCQISVRNEPENKGLSWKEYLNKVAFTKKDIDQLVLFCLAVFLGKDIMIANFPSNHSFLKPWDRICGQPEGWKIPATTPPLLLGGLRERHYEPLREMTPISGNVLCVACGTSSKSQAEHLYHSKTKDSLLSQLVLTPPPNQQSGPRCQRKTHHLSPAIHQRQHRRH